MHSSDVVRVVKRSYGALCAPRPHRRDTGVLLGVCHPGSSASDPRACGNPWPLRSTPFTWRQQRPRSAPPRPPGTGVHTYSPSTELPFTWRCGVHSGLRRVHRRTPPSDLRTSLPLFSVCTADTCAIRARWPFGHHSLRVPHWEHGTGIPGGSRSPRGSIRTDITD